MTTYIFMWKDFLLGEANDISPHTWRILGLNYLLVMVINKNNKAFYNLKGDPTHGLGCLIKIAKC
mgnify:CR=1 FL=1